MNWIETDGGTLAVEVRGAGPLVVCSPAMGDTRDAFDAFADRLVAAGFRTAQVDLRGHGESSTGFDRHGDEATAVDIVGVIEHLGAGPAVIAGASMSGAAAVIAAGRRPDLVRAVVLLSPFLRNGGNDLMRIALHLMLLRPWGPLIWRGYARKLWPGLGSDGAAARAGSTIASMRRPGRWRAFVRTSDTDHRVVAPWLAELRAPALVVVGSADPDWKDPAAEAAWVAEQVRGDRVMVAGAGHAPMLERPDEVAAATIEFLRGVTDAEGRA